MKAIFVPGIAALLALLVSCALLTEPGSRAGLQAEARPPHLHLSNPADRPVYYTIFEQSMAARVFWGPCGDPVTCPRVAPGEQLRIPYDSVSGYEEVAEPVALVYWWYLVPRSGGFEPDSIRVIHVRL